MNDFYAIAGITITEEQPFSLDNVYYTGETYTGRYSISNRTTRPITISFETTSNSNEVKTNLPLQGLQISVRQVEKVDISFTPNSTGEKKFKFFVTDGSRLKNRLLWEKTMPVQEKEESKKPIIEARVQRGLPSAMKLGQRAGVIFLFTNKGEREATGISIQIEQIHA